MRASRPRTVPALAPVDVVCRTGGVAAKAGTGPPRPGASRDREREHRDHQRHDGRAGHVRPPPHRPPLTRRHRHRLAPAHRARLLQRRGDEGHDGGRSHGTVVLQGAAAGRPWPGRRAHPRCRPARGGVCPVAAAALVNHGQPPHHRPGGSSGRVRVLPPSGRADARRARCRRTAAALLEQLRTAAMSAPGEVLPGRQPQHLLVGVRQSVQRPSDPDPLGGQVLVPRRRPARPVARAAGPAGSGERYSLARTRRATPYSQGQHRVGQLIEPSPRHDEHLSGEVAGPRLVAQTTQEKPKDRPVVQLVQVREPPLRELVDPHDRYVSGSRGFLTVTPAIVLRGVHPRPP